MRSKLLKRDKFPVQWVRALTGRDAVENRTIRLTGTATEEVVSVTGYVSVVTENLAEVQAAVPDATPFVSGLDWLRGGDTAASDTEIGRLLLIDRSTVPVTATVPDSKEGRAILGRGFGNGVVPARRCTAQGL